MKDKLLRCGRQDHDCVDSASSIGFFRNLTQRRAFVKDQAFTEKFSSFTDENLVKAAPSLAEVR
jgi:hypothetical protein